MSTFLVKKMQQAWRQRCLHALSITSFLFKPIKDQNKNNEYHSSSPFLFLFIEIPIRTTMTSSIGPCTASIGEITYKKMRNATKTFIPLLLLFSITIPSLNSPAFSWMLSSLFPSFCDYMIHLFQGKVKTKSVELFLHSHINERYPSCCSGIKHIKAPGYFFH